MGDIAIFERKRVLNASESHFIFCVKTGRDEGDEGCWTRVGEGRRSAMASAGMEKHEKHDYGKKVVITKIDERDEGCVSPSHS